MYDKPMSTLITQYVHLAPHPTSGYRQLFVKGTRISARALYGWYACDEARTPEEIAADYDLPVDAVREAIAYCESNPPELLEDYAREEALREAAGMNAPDYKFHPHPQPLVPGQWAKLRRP